MRFELEIPHPSTMRVAKVRYQELEKGTILHRVHPTIFGATRYNDTPNGDARFSPIQDHSGAIIPTIYGGETFECAACEIILRCPDTPRIDPKTKMPTLQIVSPADFELYSHSVVETDVDLKLVDLTGSGQRRLGVDQNALLAGPKSTYPDTRAWAQKIHSSCPNAQGLYYTSFQTGPRFAVVLFGDRIAGTGIIERSTRLVADPPCHNDILAIAHSLSIEYQTI